MRTITVQTNEGPREAKLIRENAKTVIVELSDGNQIKRHKVKHLVS